MGQDAIEVAGEISTLRLDPKLVPKGLRLEIQDEILMHRMWKVAYQLALKAEEKLPQEGTEGDKGSTSTIGRGKRSLKLMK
ncbi:conserved hypothetical protein [Ricinus communis]|uniref:Uncharacterized protein n=1 Tax=Ricinus communis TaxID=3988 RepID=B9S573_RICCO|nr:conserved hypothetical protein [Ricinus communis]